MARPCWDVDNTTAAELSREIRHGGVRWGFAGARPQCHNPSWSPLETTDRRPLADSLRILLTLRLAALSPALARVMGIHPGRGRPPDGMGFDESALVDGGVRSADVRAATPVECYTLSKKVFEQLCKTHAELKSGLLCNL